MTTDQTLSLIVTKMVEYAKVGLKSLAFKCTDKDVIDRLTSIGFNVEKSGDYISISWDDSYKVKQLQYEQYVKTVN